MVDFCKGGVRLSLSDSVNSLSVLDFIGLSYGNLKSVEREHIILLEVVMKGRSFGAVLGVSVIFLFSTYSFAQEASQPQQQIQPKEETPKEESPKFGFGFSFGTVVINGITYFQIKGQPEFSLGKFSVGLDINLEFDGSWNLRTSEWNSWQAILSKVRYLRWGDKRDKPVYVKIGQIENATIGYGFIMHNYNNNLNYPNVKKFGVAFDLDLDYFGVETFVDNIFDFDIMGFRAFARPLYGTGIFILDTLEVGSSLVVDIDPLNPPPPSESPYQFSDSPDSTNKVFVFGSDVGLLVFDLGPVFKMRWYSDFAYIFGKNFGAATGFFGNILSFIPYKLEVRYLQPRFLPTFFDALYESERMMFVAGEYLSKYDSLELISNSYFGWSFSSGVDFEDAVSLSLCLSDSFDETTYPTMRVDLHIDRDLAKVVEIDFTYERKNIREFKDIYTTESVDAIVLGKLSYKVSEKVNLVITYRRTFDWFDEGGQKVLKPLESTSITTEIYF